MKFCSKISYPAFIVIDLKDVTFRIIDGTPTPLFIDVKVGEGNFTYSEKRNVQYVLDRGNLDEVRLGDQVPMDVKFDFVWEYITGASPTPTVEDALKNVGQASAWISTDSDVCRPYCVDLQIWDVPNCATGDQELITFADFRWDSLDHDLKAGTVAVTGRCNSTTAVPVRSAQSSTSP